MSVKNGIKIIVICKVNVSGATVVGFFSVIVYPFPSVFSD